MRHGSQRGTTLIEAMVAITVVLVAAAGTLAVHTQQLNLNADARHQTEASAIAQDMIENISLWSYGDARLANANTANDADLADGAQAFEGPNPPYDHAEADLTLGGATWTGLTRLPAGFERYYNVAYVDDADGDGVPDSVRVAVIVRWPQGSGWRRVVAVTSKVNPAEVQ